ncbi:nuclear transport factor 2 family protein [Temperatibacter marinus]|uniref:Nuclear transport factor 2 family protein n=1 Tax=Temperatibacter marinus TaxID=1456591 RepID=A0AA52HAR5_9PROT|nr:nuclear transport factor 2 family protein [Temperatibacter marinus]WND03020.1 nuclear transport factor 2 family protein [Temperatibacter marinus]
MTSFQKEKSIVREYYSALEGATPDTVSEIIGRFVAEDYDWRGVYPFNEKNSAEAVAEAFWKPFLQSWSPVQRREDIFIAGTGVIDGETWVMSMGHFMGLLDAPWFGIPASRKISMLRYADFNCVKDGKIIKTGFFIDIIGVMHQNGINPLPMQTGASFVYPGPRTHDGLQYGDHDPTEAVKTLDLLDQMIADLDMLNKTENDHCPPELLAKAWCDDMIWYGPAGIGATYTIPRYQEQHQYPFRQGLKNKVYNGHVSRFAEGNYACFFGWPNLTNSPKGGFLGMPESDVRADMRVVDVYRRDGDKLAENWVLIDIPYWLKQQGVDILDRTGKILNGY